MSAALLTPPAFTSMVFCGAVPFSGGAAAALPTRIKILNWGTNHGRTTQARIEVGPATVAALAANQAATACERIPLDYEHQGVKDHPNFKPDPREVAAFGTVEIVPNQGVYLTALDYTPSGLLHASNYADVSAEAYLDADHNLLFIRSVALTQHGDVAGMEFTQHIAASASQISNLKSQISPSPSPQTTMLDPRPLLITLLGLTDAATDAEIQTAYDTATAPEPPEAAAVSAALSATAALPAATLAALSADVDSLRRENLITRALSAGKIIPLPDGVLATLPHAALSALLDALPAGAVATAATAAATELPAARAAVLSADQARAAKSLGLTPEEYRSAQASTKH